MCRLPTFPEVALCMRTQGTWLAVRLRVNWVYAKASFEARASRIENNPVTPCTTWYTSYANSRELHSARVWTHSTPGIPTLIYVALSVYIPPCLLRHSTSPLLEGQGNRESKIPLHFCEGGLRVISTTIYAPSLPSLRAVVNVTTVIQPYAAIGWLGATGRGKNLFQNPAWYSRKVREIPLLPLQWACGSIKVDSHVKSPSAEVHEESRARHRSHERSLIWV